MVRAGFFPVDGRLSLRRLARDGWAAHRLARRANALLPLDKGWSCVEVGEALFLDDGAVRDWHKLYIESGVEGLTRFEVGGSASPLSPAQGKALVAWISQTLPSEDVRSGT